MQRPLRRHGIAAGSCHPAGVRTLRSAGTSRSLPGRRELISENRLATQGKIATRYSWGRSVADLLATLQELDHLGVGFVSLTEALDLTTPAGRAMAGLLAIFAEFEREILRERTRAGLAHARQNGKQLGRPMTAGLQATEIRKLYRAGVPKAEIARRLRIGRTSVRRILAAKL